MSTSGAVSRCNCSSARPTRTRLRYLVSDTPTGWGRPCSIGTATPQAAPRAETARAPQGGRRGSPLARSPPGVDRPAWVGRSAACACRPRPAAPQRSDGVAPRRAKRRHRPARRPAAAGARAPAERRHTPTKGEADPARRPVATSTPRSIAPRYTGHRRGDGRSALLHPAPRGIRPSDRDQPGRQRPAVETARPGPTRAARPPGAPPETSPSIPADTSRSAS